MFVNVPQCFADWLTWNASLSSILVADIFKGFWTKRVVLLISLLCYWVCRLVLEAVIKYRFARSFDYH